LRIVANAFIDTTWVSIEKRKAGSFELRVKGNFNCLHLYPSLKNKLILEENKEPNNHQSTKLVTVQTQSHHFLLSKPLKMNRKGLA
jgi:hypothetical protein